MKKLFLPLHERIVSDRSIRIEVHHLHLIPLRPPFQEQEPVLIFLLHRNPHRIPDRIPLQPP